MNEHSAFKSGPGTFDGDAISQADPEFLASLSDNPLAQHPLYSVPPPPRPDYSRCVTFDDRTAAQEARFPAALDWILINYAYYTDAFMGKGGIISLVDGKISSIASLRSFMQPYAIVRLGPKGGIKKDSVVDAWMGHSLRMHIDGVQRRPDRSRPTFEEDGVTVYNRYWPPAHPKSGGETLTFKTFFARLVPDKTEREWFWNYLAHKARKPWVPMVAVIMVAEASGSGRGTLFEILRLLFGKTYVTPCTFGALTGKSAGARFNNRFANALIATINEADDEDGHLQTHRRLTYEALKNAIEPSPTAPRVYERKGHDAYEQESAMSVLIATNHRDLVKLPRTDRRFGVLTCGDEMTTAETKDIRNWMEIPENIGALQRALLETPAAPLDVFNPYGRPPPFAGRLEMIGMGETRLEDAFGAALDALNGLSLFTMTQAQRLIGYFGDYKTGDWTDKARHTVAKNAYRLRERDEANNRIRYRKRQEIIYARTRVEQRRWREADTRMIVAALDRAEERVTQVISIERDVFADLVRAPGSPPEDETGRTE
jgi:hypothetical protein